MSTQPDLAMDENDRCFAYNKTGQRCEGYAGHDGTHFINLAWSNDECWVPGATTITQQVGLRTPAAVYPPPPVVKQDDDEICICDHKRSTHSNKIGACRNPECDCRGFIG